MTEGKGSTVIEGTVTGKGFTMTEGIGSGIQLTCQSSNNRLLTGGHYNNYPTTMTLLVVSHFL